MPSGSRDTSLTSFARGSTRGGPRRRTPDVRKLDAASTSLHHLNPQSLQLRQGRRRRSLVRRRVGTPSGVARSSCSVRGAAASTTRQRNRRERLRRVSRLRRGDRPTRAFLDEGRAGGRSYAKLSKAQPPPRWRLARSAGNATDRESQSERPTL